MVSVHRKENVDSEANLLKLVGILNSLAEIYGKRVIISIYPRTRKRVENLGVSFHDKVELLTPLGLTDYVHLQMHAQATLSDSGTINEE